MPKVVTQRCLEQDLNPRPTDRKPKCLTRCTTAPPLTEAQLKYKSRDSQYWPAAHSVAVTTARRHRVLLSASTLHTASQVETSPRLLLLTHWQVPRHEPPAD